jgi:hypothetical protein
MLLQHSNTLAALALDWHQLIEFTRDHHAAVQRSTQAQTCPQLRHDTEDTTASTGHAGAAAAALSASAYLQLLTLPQHAIPIHRTATHVLPTKQQQCQYRLLN